MPGSTANRCVPTGIGIVFLAFRKGILMDRRCVNCGTKDNLTRDHVVSRLHLRLLLGPRYAAFCADVRKVNLQPMCGFCNNEKSDRSLDMRPAVRQIDLRNKLREYGIDHLVEWSRPSDVFSKERYIAD